MFFFLNHKSDFPDRPLFDGVQRVAQHKIEALFKHLRGDGNRNKEIVADGEMPAYRKRVELSLPSRKNRFKSRDQRRSRALRPWVPSEGNPRAPATPCGKKKEECDKRTAYRTQEKVAYHKSIKRLSVMGWLGLPTTDDSYMLFIHALDKAPGRIFFIATYPGIIEASALHISAESG